MNEIKSKILESLFFAFKKAPKGFCNSDNSEILTMEDIELRQFFQTGGLPSISDKEMVFRKFFELRNFTHQEQINRMPIQMIFLLKCGLTPEDVGRILEELVSEINDYNRFPGRTVFNPFS